MHYAELIWQQQSEERGIKIGEERGEKRGIKIGEERGEKRGIKIGEERGIKIGEERGEEKERRKSICFFIRGCKNLGICMEDIAKQLMDMYQLTYNDAMNKIHDIWG